MLATQIGDIISGSVGLVFFLALLAAVVASAVWFFRGPATAGERYVEALAMQLPNPQDAALFRNVYRTKNPKSTTLAWVLTAFLSPTIGYLYQGNWALAAISFLTLQGFLIWWAVAIFTTPLEVVAKNKRLADEAFNQVMIGRGGMAYGQSGQVINVNQYAYLPHPPPGVAATAATPPQVPSEPPPSPQNPANLSAAVVPSGEPMIPHTALMDPQAPARLD